MWDDLTQSLWQQLTGEGIVGAYTGTLLDIVPSQLVGYGAFKAQYPQGEVLSTQGRFYGSNPYVNYDSSPRPFLFMGMPDGRLMATERVLGAAIGEISVAYPFSALAQEVVINDSLAERDVVAIWQPGAVSALDAASIDQSRDVGMAALFDRQVDGRALTFQVEDGSIIDAETGSKWNIFGRATSGDLAGDANCKRSMPSRISGSPGPPSIPTRCSTAISRRARKKWIAWSWTRSWATRTRPSG